MLDSYDHAVTPSLNPKTRESAPETKPQSFAFRFRQPMSTFDRASLNSRIKRASLAAGFFSGLRGVAKFLLGFEGLVWSLGSLAAKSRFCLPKLGARG